MFVVIGKTRQNEVRISRSLYVSKNKKKKIKFLSILSATFLNTYTSLCDKDKYIFVPRNAALKSIRKVIIKILLRFWKDMLYRDKNILSKSMISVTKIEERN